MTENPPVMPDLDRNQRIVLEHRDGPHAGLFQIVGHTRDHNNQQPPELVPSTVETVSRREISASLVASKPRFLLYREIVKPEGLGHLKDFHQEQR